jgi:hypothetical protein
MASLQCTDVQDRPTECLDVTSLPLAEFQLLLPPCEAAFQAPRAAWRLEGKPRPARRFGSDVHVMLALCRSPREVVMADEELAGPDMVGELLGEGQRVPDQP